jgi:hypothetical protein
MQQHTSQEPIVFRTPDGLLTFTFTREAPSDAHAASMVTAEIAFPGGTPGPITVAIYPDGPTRLAHDAGDGADGHTLAGTLALDARAHQQITIVADLFYGKRGSHHLAGVLGSFPAPACHAPAWVLCGCSGSAHGDVAGHVAGHLAA